MNFAAAIQAAIGADTSGLQSGGKQVEGIAGKMNSALGQIGVGLSFGAVLGFFKGVTDHAGKVQDLSDRLGVGTDTLQAFTYHAGLAGVEATAAASVFEKAGKAVSQLAAGQKSATDAFAALGLAQRDLLGIPLDQQVAKIAQAYQAAKGSAGAYDAVTDILGAKTAPKLMAVIDQLASQGLPAFTDAARAAGQVIDGETIGKLDELGDRMATLKGAAITFGAAVAGKFVELSEGLGYAAANIANSLGGISTSWDVSAASAKRAASAQGEAAGKLATVLAKTTDLARYEEADFRRVMASLGPKEAIALLEERALKYRIESANATAGSAERAEKEAKAKELFADAARRAAEYGKLDREQQLELARLLAKGTANLTGEERARLDILNLQTKQLVVQAEMQPLLDKGIKNLTPEESKRLNTLVKQSDDIAKQIGLKQDLVNKTKDHNVVEEKVADTITSYVAEWDKFYLSVSAFGRGDKALSDRELARKASNIGEDIGTRSAAMLTASGPYAYDPFLEQQRYNLSQVRAEQDLRAKVRREIEIFGEERAFAMNSGISEQRFADIKRTVPDTSEQTQLLREIRQGLDRNSSAISAGLQSLRDKP